MKTGYGIVGLGFLVIFGVLVSSWGQASSQAAAIPEKIVVVGTPIPLLDALFMADVQGFFKAEGLKVEITPVASGPAGTEAFRTGVGDILIVGDLPAINNWFALKQDVRVMTTLERDSDLYWAVAKKEIQSPKDLVGKRIGTRLGSTGSYFVDIYLKKNGLDRRQVDVLNLETSALVPALDRGDIDAFFIYEPFPTRALAVSGNKVHRLSSAKGYVVGYVVVTGRRGFLQRYPEAATRFLRATKKGLDFAANNKDAVINHFWEAHKVPKDISDLMYRGMGRVMALDHQFYSDLCQEFRWAQSVGMRQKNEELVLPDWVWRDGLVAIDPNLAPSPPGRTCSP
jgi:NitT/TauT family transport system substrate-binding protein